MSKTKKLLFIMMFFMVVIACLMPNLNSGDGSDPYKHVAASSTAEPSVEDVTVVMPENYKVGNTSNFVNEDIIIDNKISDIIDSMTVEEKVAQLFFIKNDSRFDASVLEEYPVGGIILFSSDFAGETQDSLKEKLDSFQTNSDIPLLLGVDEEGGDVVRVSNYSALASDRFLSPRALYNQGGYDAVLNDTIHKSELLLSYGINVNFAPVCDVSLEPTDYMYSRSFGVSAEATADYIDYVLTRLTFVGSIYLAIVSVMPQLFISGFGLPFYFGGTSLLIVVGVGLDVIQKVESHLLTHNYDGFLKKGRIRGRNWS